MLNSTIFRKLLLIWAAWVVILLTFQALVPARMAVGRPDYAVEWTPNETLEGAQSNKPYLLDPFMNAQVSWDSEYYLGIAMAGYDDPQARPLPGPEGPFGRLNLNYAFFPLYAYVIRLFMIPLALLGLTPTATATLAGVIAAVLGTLGGMIALFDLARDDLGEQGGLRAAFYMLIFPTGFFLAQVYSEGLFVGLAFGAAALAHRRRFFWAALLAALAVWTRAVGAALVIPLALEAYQAWRSRGGAARWTAWIAPLAPLASFLAWNFSSLAEKFRFVEDHFFSRGVLLIGQSWAVWSNVWKSIGGENTQMSAYYIIEFSLIVIALAASLALLRKNPGLALFSLAIWTISLTSGVPQSMNRYVLTMPAVFLSLARWGKNEAFDRSWSTASTLLMGLLALLFTFDMWVA